MQAPDGGLAFPLTSSRHPYRPFAARMRRGATVVASIAAARHCRRRPPSPPPPAITTAASPAGGYLIYLSSVSQWTWSFRSLFYTCRHQCPSAVPASQPSQRGDDPTSRESPAWDDMWPGLAQQESSPFSMTLCGIAFGIILIVTPIVISVRKGLWHAGKSQTMLPHPKIFLMTEHPACLALGIPQLRRVPIFVQKRVHGMRNVSWQRGHYPYAACPVSRPSGSAALIKVAALLAVDHQYAEVIPRWASSSRAANVDLCVVGQVGASDLPCQAARRVGCECISHTRANAIIGRKDNSFGRTSARGRSVRYRFEYAQALLARNYTVLMLDADVFLLEDGMAKLLSFLRASVRGYDFALMSNGRRREAYDDLNWGVAWMRPSKTSKHLLSCLLGEWDHHAFSDPRTGSYGLRSQPRINHLIESSMMRGGGSSRAPLVCTLPGKLTEGALYHMTGYPTVEHKLTCARTMGLHQAISHSWSRSPQRQLRYHVPNHASPSHQRNAIVVAARLARDLNRTLVLPEAVFQGKPVKFCKLFDFVNMRLGKFLTKAEAATAGTFVGAGECAVPAAAPLENNTHRGHRGLPETHREAARAMAWSAMQASGRRRHSRPCLCVPFETLARLVHLPEWAFVCNPNSKAVQDTHVCSKRSSFNPKQRRRQKSSEEIALRWNVAMRRKQEQAEQDRAVEAARGSRPAMGPAASGGYQRSQ